VQATGRPGHVSSPLRVRRLPYWLTGLLLRLSSSALPRCFHIQTLTSAACRHVCSRQAQDQNENRPREESTRPHSEPLTVTTHSTRQRHTQSQRVRAAIESIPVHPALASSRTGTRAQVGIRVACRHSQAQGHRYTAMGKQR
jgi:hypothetical protein